MSRRNAFLCKCPACGKDVETNRPRAPYSALTPNKADLLVAFYHLGFESATKPTEASMTAALEAGALIHNKCCIQTNQVLGNALLLPEYNRLRALREVPLPAAPAFRHEDRSKAALLDKFAAASDSHQYRAPPTRACTTPAAPATQYSRAPVATAATEAVPHVKRRVQDARKRINSAALTPLVPPLEWPLLDAYLRDRLVRQPGEVVAFAGRLVLELPHVALRPDSVLAFVQSAVPRLLVACDAPGGVVPFAAGACAAPLLVPLAVHSVLHSAAAVLQRRRRVSRSGAAALAVRMRRLAHWHERERVCDDCCMSSIKNFSNAPKIRDSEGTHDSTQCF